MRGSNGTTSGSPQTTRWSWALKLRLGLTALLIVLLVALIGWMNQSIWSRVREIQQQFAAIQTEAFYLGIYLEGGLAKLNGMVLRFQLSENAAERDEFHRHSRELVAWIARTKPHLTTAAEQKLAQHLESAFQQYLAGMAPLLEKGLKPVRRDSSALVHQQIQEKSAPVLALCQQLVQCQHSALAECFSASETTLGSLHHLLQMSTLLLLVLVSVVAALAYQVIVVPLRHQLNQTQALIHRQEKLASLGVLAAGVAHEIRNPLMAIKFRLFSFKKELPESFAQHEDLGVIHSEIDRLERIVQDFLHFARPSEPVLAEVSAADLLQEVEALMQSPLQKRGIELTGEASESLRLLADKQQIQQVLINLVQNAAESIEQQGHVCLRGKPGVAPLQNRPTPVVIFEVADTGKGIPTEAEQRIFDPFFSTKEGGTGLGLSIAARIAENHGGFLHFESQLNRGTTFRLVLPRITDDTRTHSPH